MKGVRLVSGILLIVVLAMVLSGCDTPSPAPIPTTESEEVPEVKLISGIYFEHVGTMKTGDGLLHLYNSREGFVVNFRGFREEVVMVLFADGIKIEEEVVPCDAETAVCDSYSFRHWSLSKDGQAPAEMTIVVRYPASDRTLVEGRVPNVDSGEVQGWFKDHSFDEPFPFEIDLFY